MSILIDLSEHLNDLVFTGKSFMVPFYSVLPEIAEAETRRITIQGDDKSLPNGEYILLEFFCDDIDCDCRRVMISIFCPEVAKKKMLATISFGWDNNELYLDPLNSQSKYAPRLLKLVELILKDQMYVERLKHHYELFKKTVKEKMLSQKKTKTKTAKKISRNAPCSCGSGKKFKKCCGK